MKKNKILAISHTFVKKINLSFYKKLCDSKLFKIICVGPKYINIEKIFKIKFFTENNKLKFKKFDVINFGSSLQYIDHIESLNDTLNFKSVKTILVTHTPITLSKKYRSKQKNHKNLIQNVHSLDNIKKYFSKVGFKLVFKSRNDDRYIACEQKQKKTYSLNLIFIKK